MRSGDFKMKYYDHANQLNMFIIIFQNGTEKQIKGLHFEDALERNEIYTKDIKEAYGVTPIWVTE